jgi:virginiamycin B lyase
VALFALCVSAWSHAQTATSAATTAYVYWTNYDNGTVGRATTTGTGVDEKFIKSITGGVEGGAGLTVNGSYIYWTGANGGTATTIARANLNGTNVNKNFITGAHNPCGVAVNSSYIYWAGDAGTSIGRAKLNGTHVNLDFIQGLNGPIAFLAADSKNIFWADYDDYVGTTIGRAKINGTGVNQSFITGTKGAFGIAVTGGNP